MKLNEIKYAVMESQVAPATKKTLQELAHDWLTFRGVPVGGTLNERWYKLFNRVGVSWNDAAHIFLTAEGVPEGGTLNERWYIYWLGAAGTVVVNNVTSLDASSSTETQAVLTWVDAVAGTNPVAGYIIRRVGYTDSYVGVGVQTFTDVRTLKPGQAYLYVVITVDSEGAQSSGEAIIVSVVGSISGIDMSLDTGSMGNKTGYVRGSYGSVNPDLLNDGNEIRRFTVSNTGAVAFRVEGEYPQDEFDSVEIIGEGAPLLTADAGLYWSTGGQTEWQWFGTGISLLDATNYSVDFS